MVLNIITATLNRNDLLVEMVAALIPQRRLFKRLIVIDNGNQGVKQEEFMDLYIPGRNLGVAASWNYGLDESFKDPEVTHVLQINDDVVLGIEQLMDVYKAEFWTPGFWFMIGQYYWSVWLMSRECYDAMKNYKSNGVWDPNIWPAYREDNDFHRRLNMLDASKYVPNMKELTPVVMRNSQTHEAQPNITHDRGRDYYLLKWGGDLWEEKFDTPFGK